MGREAAVPFNLTGFSNFFRSNPKSDRFKVKGFHHVEFWCGDATNTSLRFSHGLGMPLVAKSDLSTGNRVHASYLIRSGNLNFLFTAPYPPSLSTTTTTAAIPTFDYDTYSSFVASHGLAVRAVALEVDDALAAFESSVAAGAHPVSEPVLLNGQDGQVTLAEVQLYGDVVLRYVSHANTTTSTHDGHEAVCCFLPKFSPVNGGDKGDGNNFGIMALDHVAGSVPELVPATEYLMGITGFHDFVEFAAEDMLGFTDTAVQAVFMANNDESVILNLTEPVHGTKQNSYAQTFLDQNQGPGVQHLAISTKDIFKTLREIKKRSTLGGFTFMPPALPEYYQGMREWARDVLTEEQIQECEELSIRVDLDHEEGVILQIFTTPVGDRPTLIIEIIQRIGCMVEGEDGELYQKGGCGGFGKGNVKRLIKSVEEYEKTLGLSNGLA